MTIMYMFKAHDDSSEFSHGSGGQTGQIGQNGQGGRSGQGGLSGQSTGFRGVSSKSSTRCYESIRHHTHTSHHGLYYLKINII